jgi:hypothetical protein
MEEEQGAGALNLYPNPTAGLLSVALKNHEEIVSVTVIDGHGRVAESFIPSGPQITLNTGNLQAGAYVLIIKTDQGVYRARFIRK